MRIPGFTGATGGETSDSEALIPSGLGDETVGVCAVSSFGSLPLMVDVEEDRVKVLVKGARWVSFNSVDKKEIFGEFPRHLFSFGGLNDGEV
jgi:hypothetical protein